MYSVNINLHGNIDDALISSDYRYEGVPGTGNNFGYYGYNRYNDGYGYGNNYGYGNYWYNNVY